MTNEEITEVQKHFQCYSTEDYSSCYITSEPIIGKYFHKEEDNFHLIIFKDNSVYQLNSDHETQGVELKDYDALINRFESFTGEKIDNHE